MVPVEVSESPKIMLKGKNSKHAHALFSQQNWVVIYKYIKQNREVIQKHWMGEFDTFDLFEGLQPKPINLSERERKNEQL